MSDEHIKSALEEQIYNKLVALGINDNDAKFLARIYVMDKICMR